MLVYLTLKNGQHLSRLDRNYVESVFESFSVKSKDASPETKDGTVQVDELDLITKGNAILAYEQVFKMWKVELNVQQQTKLRTAYFEQAWDRYNEDGNLNLKDSWRFMRDLMTMPVLKKDPTIDQILHTAKNNQ